MFVGNGASSAQFRREPGYQVTTGFRIQLRAARALAGLDQKGLADRSGIGVNTIRAMEASGAANVPGLARTLDKVVGARKAAGVTFVDDDGDGRGVRLKSVTA